jgi:hypothetical protein
MKKKAGEIIGGLLFAALFVGLGLIMVLNPDLNGYEPHGKHLLIKKLVAWVWSMPTGVISIVLGLLTAWGTFIKDDEKPEQSEKT